MYKINIGDADEISEFEEELRRRRNELKSISKENKRIAQKINREILKPLEQKVKEDRPPVRLPGDKVNWKSPRQRKLVMMQYRKAGIEPPYPRTDKMVNSFEANAEVNASGTRISVNIENTDPKAPYVLGEFGVGKSASSIRRYEKPIQPFHKERWEPAYKKVQPAIEASQEMYEEEISEWVEKTFTFKK